MANIADRSGPDPNIVQSSQVNTEPASPFYICPKNGHYVLTDALVPSEYLELTFQAPTTLNYAIGEVSDHNQFILGWIEVDANVVLIHPNGLLYYDANGEILASVFNNEVCFKPDHPYVLHLRVLTDVVSLRIRDMVAGDQLGATKNLSVPGAHNANRSLVLGYPTNEILAFTPYDGRDSLKPALDFVIISTDSENPGPTYVVDIFPKTFLHVPRHAGAILATVAGQHVRGYPLTYSFTGASNDDKFSIVGDKVVMVEGAVFDPSTVYEFYVRIYDQWKWNSDVVTHLAYGPALPPTDLTIDTDTIAEGQTDVGTFASTSAMDGDVFTYSLVAGTGDTNNDLFSISTADLAFISPSVEGEYTIRVRTTSATGLYYEKPITITVTV